PTSDGQRTQKRARPARGRERGRPPAQGRMTRREGDRPVGLPKKGKDACRSRRPQVPGGSGLAVGTALHLPDGEVDHPQTCQTGAAPGTMDGPGVPPGPAGSRTETLSSCPTAGRPVGPLSSLFALLTYSPTSNWIESRENM
ncbi:hypothetical protein LTR66_014968, partial [Elasticomyces elasticus]